MLVHHLNACVKRFNGVSGGKQLEPGRHAGYAFTLPEARPIPNQNETHFMI